MASIRLRSLLRCRRRSQQAMLLLLLLLAVSGAQSTRLPLEVYELTSTDQTAAKHKSLEYTIYDAKELTGAAAAAAATAAPATAAAAAAGTTTSQKPLTVAVVSISAEQQHETETELETESEPAGRRARQMLLQQQQQQHRLAGSSSSGSNRHSKDLRILYQVGVSLLLINKIFAANYTRATVAAVLCMQTTRLHNAAAAATPAQQLCNWLQCPRQQSIDRPTTTTTHSSNTSNSNSSSSRFANFGAGPVSIFSCRPMLMLLLLLLLMPITLDTHQKRGNCCLWHT